MVTSLTQEVNTMRIEKEYRKIGRHLYQLQGGALVHVWRLPARFEYASITTALNWYQATIKRADTLWVQS